MRYKMFKKYGKNVVAEADVKTEAFESMRSCSKKVGFIAERWPDGRPPMSDCYALELLGDWIVDPGIDEAYLQMSVKMKNGGVYENRNCTALEVEALIWWMRNHNE